MYEDAECDNNNDNTDTKLKHIRQLDKQVPYTSHSFVFQINTFNKSKFPIHLFNTSSFTANLIKFHCYADSFYSDNIILNVKFRGNINLVQIVLKHKLQQLIDHQWMKKIHNFNKIMITKSTTTYQVIKQKISQLFGDNNISQHIQLYKHNSIHIIKENDKNVDIETIEWTLSI